MPFLNKDYECVMSSKTSSVPGTIRWDQAHWQTYSFNNSTERDGKVVFTNKDGIELSSAGFSVRSDKTSDRHESNNYEVHILQNALDKKATIKKVERTQRPLHYTDGSQNIFILYGKGFKLQYGDKEPVDVDTTSDIQDVFKQLSVLQSGKTYPLKVNLLVKVYIPRNQKGSFFYSLYLEKMQIIEFKPSVRVHVDGDSDDESIPSEEEQDEESDDE